jgi:hypothetical protein
MRCRDPELEQMEYPRRLITDSLLPLDLSERVNRAASPIHC